MSKPLMGADAGVVQIAKQFAHNDGWDRHREKGYGPHHLAERKFPV
jgi:hypothetical protein